MRTISLSLLVLALPLLAPAARAEAPDFYDEAIPAALHLVTMTPGDRFSPATLTIRRGDTVEWLNRDDEVHTVTADPSKATNPAHYRLPPGVSAFDSGDIPAGKAFTKTFTVPGSYMYFCIPHQDHGMLGTIQVLP